MSLSFPAKRSGVENGAAGEASRTGGERIKSLIFEGFSNTSQRCLDFTRHDKKGTEEL
jgi:hypothetical protein